MHLGDNLCMNNKQAESTIKKAFMKKKNEINESETKNGA